MRLTEENVKTEIATDVATVYLFPIFFTTGPSLTSPSYRPYALFSPPYACPLVIVFELRKQTNPKTIVTISFMCTKPKLSKKIKLPFSYVPQLSWKMPIKI